VKKRTWWRRFIPESTFEYVQAIIALSVTFAYLGMLIFSLVNSFIPDYAAAFNTLIDWSIVPGIIWGFYFGSTVYKAYRAYTG
jgi:hypothetical protein